MKHYKTTKHEEEMLQITTKLNKQNHRQLTTLKERLNNQGVVINQQELLNDILEHCFNSNEKAIQIDNDEFSYREIINDIELDNDTLDLFDDNISIDLNLEEYDFSDIEEPTINIDESIQNSVENKAMSEQEIDELLKSLMKNEED